MTSAAGKARAAGSLLAYGLLAGSIWLAWEVIKAPVVQRAPPVMALRLAPGSAEALQRAAEDELVAGRLDNAEDLAAESLARAPFNVRALRVDGLVAARKGRTADADQILTLAGNWSLRDDPTHAWLIEHRLRQGNYQSAFAHADTLARRREELYPNVFKLFTVGALQDRRAVAAVSNLLAANPPWRPAYTNYLNADPNGNALLLTLAINLEKTKGRFTDDELGVVYARWAREGRIDAIRFLREKLNRPPLSPAVQNGGFDTAATVMPPFGWSMGVGPGLVVEMIEDDTRDNNSALRVDYDGYGGVAPTEQLLMLRPGEYSLSGQLRMESGPADSRLSWTLSCLGGAVEIGEYRLPAGSRSPGAWRAFSTPFTVPASGCPAQWLRLKPHAGDDRAPTAVWFDNLKVSSRPAAHAQR